ncbi:glycerate kinase [Nocardioides sp. zg-536]|uniref:Glycerate kinase n=1 Tax=Nocardioides faecalis TaxID=2803858 RepID=A0A938Y8S6_9ACTN|nr:glycerate kinase [Nocardioides faecalis]MBM9461390.1 glycerate kinase [Nocardioides faecalis]QVI57652.1 glycerate kinase [Nocardioides faecalis]
MRVLVAPDKFAGTLTAVEAAEAIAVGWHRHAPQDEVVLAPMSDGGPGFVDVLHASLGGDLLAVSVAGPARAGDTGDTQVPATLLLVGGTAYVESAQACGIHLTGGRHGERHTTAGVGALVKEAVAAGAQRVVVGLGGSGTVDGGAGLLAALGARADVPLDAGGAMLRGVRTVDLRPARAVVTGVDLVAATDVDSPLAGLFGAAKTFGAQKGLDEGAQIVVDGYLQELALATDRRLALEPGAGAAGGLGFALLLLGGARVPGFALVADAVGLAEHARHADIVITGEGSFDFSSRTGKVPAGVAAVAAEALRPCVVLAGEVLVGAREMRALGMDGAYSLVDAFGRERAFADPAGALSDLAARVARTWSA